MDFTLRRRVCCDCCAERVGEQIEFRLFNQAEAIPDYALPRLERALLFTAAYGQWALEHGVGAQLR